MNRTIVLAIHTEYHLLFALRLICSMFDRYKDSIYIIKISPTGANRLRNDYNFENTGIHFREITYSLGFFKSRKLKYDLNNQILDLKPDIYVAFNDIHYFWGYLIPKLKKQGTQVFLAPDGMNLYSNKESTKYRIINFLYGNLFLWSNGFFSYSRMLGKYHASRREVDVVIIENKDAFLNKYKKQVIEFAPPVEKQKEIQELTNHVFNYQPEWFKLEPASILWIDQPFQNLYAEVEKEKWDILLHLRQRFPQTLFYIKPHPFTAKSFIEKFVRQFNAIEIPNRYPAELIIENAYHVSILSIHSTSLLLNNIDCKYYWLFPLFANNANSNIESIPLKHITGVKDIKEIQVFQS